MKGSKRCCCKCELINVRLISENPCMHDCYSRMYYMLIISSVVAKRLISSSLNFSKSVLLVARVFSESFAHNTSVYMKPSFRARLISPPAAGCSEGRVGGGPH